MGNKIKSKSTIKRIFKYISKYKIRVLLVLIFSILESLISVFSPKIAGKGITALSSTDSFGNPNIDLNYIFNLLAFLLVLYSLTGLFSCLGRYLFTDVSVKIVYDIRREISKKMNVVSIESMQSKNHGDVLSCIVNDAEVISSSFIESMRSFLSSLILSVGTIYMMLSINLQMSLCVFLTFPIMIIVALIIIKKSQKHYDNYRTALANTNSFIEESCSGYETIKSYKAEKNFIDKFDKLNNTLYFEALKSSVISGLMMPIMTFVSKLIYVICCILGSFLAITKKLQVGNIVAFTVYTEQFIKPFIDISSALGNLQSTFSASKRVFEFLDAPEEPKKNLLFEFDENASIEFKNVSFKYDENSDYVINNISFKINPNETVAIVGKTGGGKTTILKLLMRFYKVSSGEILINGKNIEDFEIKSYRNFFGLVTQNPWLYSASIRENIKYGNFKADDKEVEKLTKLLKIDDFVNCLPRKYETVVNEKNSNVSEGQKNLICMARAILSNRKFLIMDEATSNIDTITENCIQESIEKILHQKTAVIVAHRLSTIKRANKILVIDNGKITEFGTHSELILKKGVYFEMYKSSM